MKGITGHRVHDAYANMALGPLGGVRGKAEQQEQPIRRAPTEAASVQISEGARKLAQGGPVEDPARITELKEKAKLGPSAFDANIVAQKMVAEFVG